MLARGTTEHDYKKLTEELDRYAITLSGSARMDFASVSTSAVSHQADRAMRLLAEAVRAPTFPADELTEYVDQTVTGLMVTERAPEYLADRERRPRRGARHPDPRPPATISRAGGARTRGRMPRCCTSRETSGRTRRSSWRRSTSATGR
jgi:predicted Zn-dependent peptidase